jgi:hypothetical protein
MKINITAEAHDAMVRVAELPFVPGTATRRADGSWDIEIGEDTLERLHGVTFEGETISDALVRLIEFFRTGGRRN